MARIPDNWTTPSGTVNRTLERSNEKVVIEATPDLTRILSGTCTMEQAAWMAAAHQMLARYKDALEEIAPGSLHGTMAGEIARGALGKANG